MRSLLRALPFALCALLLSACSGPAPASPADFVRQHTACPVTHYLSPQWMPSGTSLIYTSANPLFQIRQINADGSGDHLFIDNAILPAISPDGKSILFARSAQNGQGRDFSILDLASGQEQVVIHGEGAAAWSPSGAAIVHASVSNGFGRLSVTELGGGGVLPLTADPIPGMLSQPRPLWSPAPGGAGDGEWIAFDGTSEDQYRAVIIPASGGDPVIVEPPDDGRCPEPIPESDSVQAWLPDSGAAEGGLAITRVCSVNLGLMIVDPFGAIVAEMPDVKAEPRTLEWSASGRMVYVENVGGVQQIMVADADGSNVRMVYPNGWDPHWSPGPGEAGDGERIAFVMRDQAGISGIYTIAADGSDFRPLVIDPNAGKICLK